MNRLSSALTAPPAVAVTLSLAIGVTPLANAQSADTTTASVRSTPTIRTTLNDSATPHQCDGFSELYLTLEQNATDGDTEVVLFAKGQDEGLRGLAITGPNGKEVALIAANPFGIGLREFLLESAEPPDIDRVLATFPEGRYRFSGKTVTGQCLRGQAELSHDLAPATSLLTPSEEDVVAIDNVVLSWETVPEAERYIVELNNENTGAEMIFTVFPPTTSLSIPASLLTTDSEYQFGVGVRTENGNLTVVELTFFTAP